ncbi:MAG: GNAT family N-acetyltransferase [Nocardioides sp.]
MTYRPATPDDAPTLAALERDVNIVALAHVFPGVPYPEDDVRERWVRLIADPDVHVEVAGPRDRLDAYLAWDRCRLRHLGVRPERWGTGLARAGLERAAQATLLWVLVANHQARGCYEHLGWRPTGREQEAEWPPYPRELEYAR